MLLTTLHCKILVADTLDYMVVLLLPSTCQRSEPILLCDLIRLLCFHMRILCAQEREELIQEWTPEPLVPDDADQDPIKYDVIQGKVTKCIKLGSHALSANASYVSFI